MVSAIQARLLARARAAHSASGPSSSGFNAVEEADDYDALDRREEKSRRSSDPHSMSAWPPSRGQKRSHDGAPQAHQPVAGSSKQPVVIDVDDEAPKKPVQLGSGRIELATCNVSVKGLKEYGGRSHVQSGGIVKLVREPNNQYDTSAIKITLVDGTTLGYIPRGTAAHLAPLMDAHAIMARARAATFTQRPTDELSMTITLLGKPELADDPRLKFAKPASASAPAPAPAKTYTPQAVPRSYNAAKGGNRLGGPKPSLPPVNAVPAASAGGPAYPGYNGIPGQPGVPMQPGLVPGMDPSVADGLAAMTAHQQAMEYARPDTLATLFTDLDPATLPQAPQPDLKTKLLPHQLQALRWMTQQEHPKLPVDDTPVQLWQKRKTGAYFNVASKDLSIDPPELARGGILADDMGLGKTLSAIALMASDPDGSDCLPKEDVEEEVDDRYIETTLVVCPLSVVGNWSKQLSDHSSLSYHVYHGEGRGLSRSQLRQYDVVVTTYQTIANEYVDPDPPKKKSKKAVEKQKQTTLDGEKRQGKLHRLAWRRVVLDEGHTIRNVKTQMSRACQGLRAERRWSLTGTPLINSSKDAGAALAFLRLCAPLDDPTKWSLFVERKFKRGTGPILLKAVVTATTLRRTKDMTDSKGVPIVKLPALKVFRHTVTLDAAARAAYTEVEKGIQLSVRRTIKEEGDLSSSYSVLLVFLLRLRQLASHPALCPQEFVEEVREGLALLPPEPEDESVMKIEERHKLQRLLVDLQYEECSICFSGPQEPIITRCQHAFCNACINQVIELATSQNKPPDCPMCRRPISKDMLVPLPDEPLPPADDEDDEASREQSRDVIDFDSDSITSAKSRELIRLLKGARKENARSLVFSQWTTHLDLIGAALDDADIAYSRFDGSMSAKKRDKVVNCFQAGKGPDVMLLSLHAGALGLNLTAASCVFLMDPWWQSSIEQQAIDRAHRLGQRNEVRVFSMICENTVEERVLSIQKKKEDVIANAFAGIRAATKSQQSIETRMHDLMSAFGMGDED